MQTVFNHRTDIPLTENHIKQLPRDLLIHFHRKERHCGSHKTLVNNVEAFDRDDISPGVVFATASPFDTPLRMTDLIGWFRDQEDNKNLHPLLVIAKFAIVFIEIHPF